MRNDLAGEFRWYGKFVDEDCPMTSPSEQRVPKLSNRYFIAIHPKINALFGRIDTDGALLPLCTYLTDRPLFSN